MDGDWSVELGPDDPALEFPWASPDGAPQWVDLRQKPEGVAAIPEAAEYPELAECLLTVNAAQSPWFTVKCDVWIDRELGEAEEIYGANVKMGSYVDLVSRGAEVQFSFEQHESWVKAAARASNSAEEDDTACEFIVRRCWFLPEEMDSSERPAAGFYVTIYVSGYGRDDREARRRWAQGLGRVTSMVASLAP